MGEHIIWEEPDQEHIASRSERYAGAMNIQPEWTQEAVNDPMRLLLNPDPRSASGAARIVGYSAAAECVITVIAESIGPRLWRGRTAFPTSGRELRDYERRLR